MNAVYVSGPGDFEDWRMARDKRDAAVEARAEQIAKDMWQDLEYVTDAVNDAAITIGYYRRKDHRIHPLAVTFLTLLRDGSDDLELVRMLRQAANDYINETARDRAEEEIPE